MRILFVDIDHTLTAAHWRNDMIEVAKRDRDWDTYHKESINDKPITEMIALVNCLQVSGWYIVGLTTRPEKWRQLTNDWLLRYEVRIDKLLMRPHDDFRPDAQSKLDIVTQFIAHHQVDSIIVIDDNDYVVSSFRAQNVTVLQAYVSGR
jgi:hypothetical protein